MKSSLKLVVASFSLNRMPSRLKMPSARADAIGMSVVSGRIFLEVAEDPPCSEIEQMYGMGEVERWRRLWKIIIWMRMLL